MINDVNARIEALIIHLGIMRDLMAEGDGGAAGRDRTKGLFCALHGDSSEADHRLARAVPLFPHY